MHEAVVTLVIPRGYKNNHKNLGKAVDLQCVLLFFVQ